jgi:putative transposase
MLSVVTDDAAHSELAMSLDELAREGARRMLAAALEAEVDAYIAAHAALTDEHGHRLVRRNGHAPARQLATGAGQVEVVRPRVDDRRVDPATGLRMRFQSVILPRWVRRSPKVAEVLPLLYLHGLSSSDFVPALEELFGSRAGLSASVVTRLTTQWQAEREAFAQRDLSEVDYVYCWADGVHFSIRLGDQGRLCCLVIVGVRADGRKELVAVADGTRESTDDWAELLRDLRRRGMRAPVVMVGDGALGLWRALREVFPATREQRCWVHGSRKESTWCFRRRCVLLTVHEVQKRCRGGESSSGRGDGVAVLFQERADVQERVADGARADVEQVGQDAPGADSA